METPVHQPSDQDPIRVTVARGDGIGPEIMSATVRILTAAGARLEFEEIEVGLRVYERGIPEGITAEGWHSLTRTRVFLKAPVTTPQGGGMSSLNVNIRTALGLHANIRPCRSFAPFVATNFPGMDVVIVRENEEDVYTGIEYQQTSETAHCLKLTTRPGCERIVRCAFEYARSHQRRRVTCMTKDNIMKMTDGLFHRVFSEIAAEYPEIESEHLLVDIGAALLATQPERFDVIVTTNLYGDILSDVAAQLSGSVGLAGSMNLGRDFAMFEAVHGSAPSLAEQDVANPSALLQAAVLMLAYVGQKEVAEKVQNAWLATLESGIHTGDIFHVATSKERVGTFEFARAIIDRLGERPKHFAPAAFLAPVDTPLPARTVIKPPASAKVCVGIDVFLEWSEANRCPVTLAERLETALVYGLRLEAITNRGAKVFPDAPPGAHYSDQWRCRFIAEKPTDGAPKRPGPLPVNHTIFLGLLTRLSAGGFIVTQTQNLYTFDGKPAYSAISARQLVGDPVEFGGGGANPACSTTTNPSTQKET